MVDEEERRGRGIRRMLKEYTIGRGLNLNEENQKHGRIVAVKFIDRKNYSAIGKLYKVL